MRTGCLRVYLRVIFRLSLGLFHKGRSFRAFMGSVLYGLSLSARGIRFFSFPAGVKVQTICRPFPLRRLHPNVPAEECPRRSGFEGTTNRCAHRLCRSGGWAQTEINVAPDMESATSSETASSRQRTRAHWKRSCSIMPASRFRTKTPRTEIFTTFTPDSMHCETHV